MENLSLETRPRLQRPSLWGAIFLNDDFTPMDFVVAVLMKIFNKSADDAFHIMMTVHREGRACAGVYPRDIAELKAQEAVAMALYYEHPMQVVAEPVS